MNQHNDEADRLYELFGEYRSAYAAEWERLDRCERIYRGEHWLDVPMADENEPRPVTPVIQSTIENVRADLMDQMPEAVVTADDPKYSETAEMLTSVIRDNHRAGRFDREYALMLHDLLVGGYMVEETGFDADGNDGLGTAFIRHVDAHNIMFDPLAADMQDSRAVFKFTPYPREWFEQRYPDQVKRMQPDTYRVLRQNDAHLNRGSDNSILLIECWQREYDPETRRFSVHMKKLAGREVLEDSRKGKPEGYYMHGQYPFVVAPLFVRKGTALGYGFVDMFETQQKYSDKLDQIVLKNALMASHNKLLVTAASGFDVSDLSDWSKEVHKGESLSGITWFPTAPLPGYILSYIENIRNGIKEESGSNDFSRGETYGGVTAASAIAALQEASSKRSRMIARAVHCAFEEAVRQEIEVEREFALFARITPVASAGRGEYGLFSADSMYERTELHNRLPIEFMVSVKAQRENRFSVAAHNELILKLVQMAMITPAAGLELMLFDGKQQALSLMRQQARETVQAQAAQGAQGAQGVQAAQAAQIALPQVR